MGARHVMLQAWVPFPVFDSHGLPCTATLGFGCVWQGGACVGILHHPMDERVASRLEVPSFPQKLCVAVLSATISGGRPRALNFHWCGTEPHETIRASNYMCIAHSFNPQPDWRKAAKKIQRFRRAGKSGMSSRFVLMPYDDDCAVTGLSLCLMQALGVLARGAIRRLRTAGLVTSVTSSSSQTTQIIFTI